MNKENKPMSAFDRVNAGKDFATLGKDAKEALAKANEQRKIDKAENQKAVNRIARLGRFLIKYWRFIAVMGVITTSLAMSGFLRFESLKDFFEWLNPGRLASAAEELIPFAFSWSVVVIGSSAIFATRWVTWFRPKEKTFDAIWIEKLGIAFELKPKKDDQTDKQYIEELLTDVIGQSIEDERFKEIVERPDGRERKFRKKFFNQDVMRKEARQYYFQHYLPIMQAKERGRKLRLEQEKQKTEEVIINEQGFIQ